jgi:hypothetical protein
VGGGARGRGVLPMWEGPVWWYESDMGPVHLP